MDEDIAEQFARRDRFIKHMNSMLTPEQRMEKMAKLQAQSWAVLRDSQKGYAHFIRRNFKARSIDTSRFNVE
jgi:hypothetical protein